MQASREQCLMGLRRVVVKVGSAVLTTPDGLDLAMVENLARQIALLRDRGLEVALVSSGAVAAGRGVLRRSKRIGEEGREPEGGDLPFRQAASAVGQSRLMHAYDEAFARHGKITAQVLLTRDDLRSRRRFLNARNTLFMLLGWGAIPIVNENDTVVVSELEFGDNDQLGALLINVIEADLFVNLTSADGVLSGNPDESSDACKLDYIADPHSLDLNAMCGAKTAVGAGGMYSKLLAARRAAQIGAPTLILPGREEDVLARALAPETTETLGTWVGASCKPVTSRKFWLAYNMAPSGELVVDAGAIRALTGKGTSLLAVGIVRVEGNFGRGALVRIKSEGGDVVAVGLVNYSAAELRRVAGMKTADAEKVLGYGYSEAVHRDNMLLDAVV